jgi:hypothetical protein
MHHERCKYNATIQGVSGEDLIFWGAVIHSIMKVQTNLFVPIMFE